jgi:hypothetical protein
LTTPKPLIFCGVLAGILWFFAAVLACLNAFDRAHAFMECASILIAAWAIGSVLNEKL